VARRAPSQTAIVNAFLRLILERGWGGVSLLDIARRAEVSLADLYRLFSSKEAILAAFSRSLDDKMLAGDDPSDDPELPRERLLDVILRRLDAMTPHKEAVRVLWRDLPRDPVAWTRLRSAVLDALGAMLEAAGIDSSGLRGALRKRVLGIVFAQAVRVWLDDDSPDLTRTTAELDRRLRRASGVLNLSREPRPLGGATAPAWSGEPETW
jgi:AcrR family transcriptional regulator